MYCSSVEWEGDCVAWNYICTAHLLSGRGIVLRGTYSNSVWLLFNDRKLCEPRKRNVVHDLTEGVLYKTF